MKTKICALLMIALTTCFISCEEELTEPQSKLEEIYEVTEAETFNDFNYSMDEEGILVFEDETTLVANLNNKSYKEVREDARSLRDKGFVALNPMFDGNDNELEEAFLKRRVQKAESNNYFYTNKVYDKDFADLEDDIISDPKFAAILNEDREIIVGKKFYKYTPYGLFYSHKKHKKHLRRYLKNLASSKTGKSEAYKLAGDCGQMQKQAGNTSPKYQKVVAIDDKISLFSSCGGGGIAIGGGSGGSSGSSNSSIALDYKNNLSICSIDQESVWQKIFGAAETCEEYFDNKRRVKVKFWSQNYLVYASIGTSTKFQKKYWLGWQTSNAVDFTELGINHASFTYKKNVSGFDKVFKDMNNDILIRWKNDIWTADGRRVTNIPFSLPKWPFENGDFDKFALEIYLNKNINFTYNDKNAYKDILKAAKSFISGKGKLLNDLQEAVEDDKLVVKGVVYVTKLSNLDRMIVTVNERFERDNKDCCATHVLDRNFLWELKFGWRKGNFQVEKQPTGQFVTSNGGETVEYVGHETATWSPPIPVPKLGVFNATDYEDFSIDFYGVARRDGKTYKGRRIIGTSVKK